MLNRPLASQGLPGRAAVAPDNTEYLCVEIPQIETCVQENVMEVIF